MNLFTPFSRSPAAWMALAGLLASGLAVAKLPPLSDDAKAKAAEAAAKTAYAAKLDGYKLCLAMDKVAAGYQASAARASKPAPTPTATPQCAEPGPFVSTLVSTQVAAAAATTPPLEAAAAHSPARTAAAPPSTLTPAAQQPAKK